MLLNFDSIYDFVLALELLFLVEITSPVITLILLIILWNRWRLKLEVSPVQFQIYKLVYQLTRNLAIPRPQILDLDVIYIRKTKLLEVVDHLS